MHPAGRDGHDVCLGIHGHRGVWGGGEAAAPQHHPAAGQQRQRRLRSCRDCDDVGLCVGRDGGLPALVRTCGCGSTCQASGGTRRQQRCRQRDGAARVAV